MDLTNVKRMVYRHVIDSHPVVSQEYAQYMDTGPDPSRRHYGGKIKEIVKLNWKYRVCRQSPDADLSQLAMPEKNRTKLPSPAQLAEKLMAYDVISFDVFDTLVFRATQKPKDVFRLLEGEWNCIGFAKLREEAEQDARAEKGEVTIDDIYRILARETGIDPQAGILREIQTEQDVCFANPFMMEVYRRLIQKGKKVIAVSDMYLQRGHMEAILKKCGYRELSGIYVSCDYGKGKGDGKLQQIVQAENGKRLSYIHIGDNPNADILGSRKAGWAAYHYPNIQAEGHAYRRKEMTSLAASFYNGLVNYKMHCGRSYGNAYFEYGYVYGGIMAYGYCQYLDRLARREGIDQLLFVARDGYILHKVYREMFGAVDCAYIPFSRFAAYQLTMERNWRNFLLCCVNPRTRANPAESVRQAMKTCDLEWIREYLPEYGLTEGMRFDGAAYAKLERLFEGQAAQLARQYEGQAKAAKRYFSDAIGGHKKVCIVDVGWQGTGALSLKYFLEEKCGMGITVCGALMGANQNGPAETGLDTQKLYSYLFSAQKNKELLLRHFGKQQEIHYRNLLMEILFTEDQPSFLKFGQSQEDGKVAFVYGAKEGNRKAILGIQAGIYSFCKDFARYGRRFPGWLEISGREAYLPFDALAGAKGYCLRLLGDYEVNENAGIFGTANQKRTLRQVVG